MKKTFKLCFSFLISLIFTFFPLFFLALSAKEDTKIVIYHTNDLHGQIESVWDGGDLKKIGFDILKSAKDNTPNSVLIDAGDVFQGTMFGKADNGGLVMDMMNHAGYDFMVPGNHDFDFGIEGFKKLGERANFPMISANVRFDSLGNTEFNGDFLKKNLIKEIGGKRIGFFGITTEETTRTTIPENVKGIYFDDEIKTAREQVAILKRKNVDAVVAVAHLGVGVSTVHTSREMAQKVPGIDVIVDAHSHTELNEKVNGVLISQTGFGASNLGKIELTFKEKLVKSEAFLISASECGKIFAPDEEITLKYERYYETIAPFASKVMGRSRSAIFGGTYANQNISRLFETPAGNLICDAMIFNSGKFLQDEQFRDLPVVAFENGGSVKRTIEKGFIKMSDIVSVLPLENRITAQIISPKDLYQVFERGVGKMSVPTNPGECFGGAFGGFPQIAGAKFYFDVLSPGYDYANNKGGSRVKSVFIIDEKGKELKNLERDDDKTKLVFLCNDYTVCEFSSVSGKEIIKKGELLANILAEYIQYLTLESGGSFDYPLKKNRVNLITVPGNESAHRFESEITVCDESGILPFTEMEVLINDQERLKITTNADGIMIIPLGFGNHKVIIKYRDKESEILLSNIAGIKNGKAFLSKKIECDFESVSNIIGQIPYIISQNIRNLIKFARESFNLLNEKSKNRVLNYCKLENAERELAKLDGNYFESVFKKDDKIIITALILILISIFVFLIIKLREIKINKQANK